MTDSCSPFDPESFRETLDTPAKLHEYAVHYNWDEGFDIPRWIVNNEICDRGTALMLYWKAGPRYFCQFSSREEVPSMGWDRQLYDLLLEIEQKYLHGFYRNRAMLFNPRFDPTIGMLGHDWTQEYDGLSQRRQIPPEMFEPSMPDLEWEAMGKPIRPIKHANYSGIFGPIGRTGEADS